jgi:hypothetical protein
VLESNLPSPDLGSNGFHLRRSAAKNISSLEIAGMGYPNRSHPGAAKLAAFFAACSAAAATIGKAIPALTLTPQASTGAAGSTQQLTLGKGGSSGAVTWLSSNPAAATVNASGLVTRVATGVAVITANVAEGAAHKAGSVSATITVA